VGERDRHLGVRDPLPLRDDRRRVLARLAQDEVRPPRAACALDRGEHGGGPEPAEQLPVPQLGGLLPGRRRQRREDRPDLRVGRSGADPRRVARDQRLQPGRHDDQPLVPGAGERVEDRQERHEVARSRRRGHEHPHACKAMPSMRSWSRVNARELPALPACGGSLADVVKIIAYRPSAS
jgi:hypothetical protein